MAATALDPPLTLQMLNNQRRGIVEEIEGLIRVYKDGHVERPQIVPYVNTELAPELGVMSRDVVIDKFTNIWARFYVPNDMTNKGSKQLPLIVYFHGGGFCVGSASWICYHEFLARLAAKAGCLIMSVNYRLAPENPLPAAYEDGFKSLMWIKQEALSGCNSNNDWWCGQCNFSTVFLAGDSAGANIAYNVATRVVGAKALSLNPLTFKGTILIQPFFGGETRTNSEKYMVQRPRSALSLSASDTYWRLSLPRGANRDHPWCNPLTKGSTKVMEEMRNLGMMVCISEMDILRDRNLEFCSALRRAGNHKVEQVVYKGVGHAFQILSKSHLSQARTSEIVSHVKAFITQRL